MICPVCNKKEAVKGDPNWGHHLFCCSKQCGIKLGKIIEKNKSSKEYIDTMKKIDYYTTKITKLKYKGVNL